MGYGIFSAQETDQRDYRVFVGQFPGWDTEGRSFADMVAQQSARKHFNVVRVTSTEYTDGTLHLNLKKGPMVGWVEWEDSAKIKTAVVQKLFLDPRVKEMSLCRTVIDWIIDASRYKRLAFLKAEVQNPNGVLVDCLLNNLGTPTLSGLTLEKLDESVGKNPEG